MVVDTVFASTIRLGIPADAERLVAAKVFAVGVAFGGFPVFDEFWSAAAVRSPTFVVISEANNCKLN